MSKSAGGIDWMSMLEAAALSDARPITDEELELWRRGLFDGSGKGRAVYYVHAAQAAIEKQNPHELLEMLHAEIPIPPFLLPAIAAVIHALIEGAVGKPSALTALEDRTIRAASDRIEQIGGLKRPKRKNAKSTAINTYLAKARGVSNKTIQRSLARTKKTDAD